MPIYPRPVSPLNAEPLRSKLNDVYLDDPSDSFSDGEQRATKRRRIEKLGQQYLRGDGPLNYDRSSKVSSVRMDESMDEEE